MKMKKLYYVAAILGFAAVLCAAAASDGGADLLYTVPAAIAGTGILCWGIAGIRRIDTAERWKAYRVRRNRAAYRAGLAKARNHG